MKINRNTFWLILTIVFALTLSGCGAATPTPTEAPVQVEDALPAMGRINGRVEFQAPPTPATVLYVVNVSDPTQWFTRDLAASDGTTPYEIEIPAGNYQVYARQADGPMVAAYLNPDETLGTINVPAGQVVNEVILKFAAPQNICQRTAIPASPDGRFPAIDPTTCPSLDPATEAPTAETLGTIRGTIGYQAPQTPLSMLYFVSAERWYYLEVPGGNPVSSFEWQVAPGTYQLYAFIVGSEGGSGFYRPSAAGPITVSAGQVVENVYVGNVNSDLCVAVPIPASPDGRFPALEESCSAFPTDTP